MTGRAATALLLHCRAGFEGECAKEMASIAAQSESLAGFVRSKPGSAYVEFVFHQPVAAGTIRSTIRFRDLVFARQMIAVATWIDGLPAGDRVTPLMPHVIAMGTPFSAVSIETADTNEAKELSAFCRGFSKPLGAALRAAALLQPDDCTLPRLHLFFTGSSRACIGWSDADNSSPWPMGIPRLSMPRQAPSRSTLKLAEAIDWFLAADEQHALLREGLTAVDLGASPGGWTYQLVRRGVAVTAVDNGPIDDALLDSGLVEHLRADGFAFRPRYPVEWMVCDIVEQPIRVARLVAEWLADGDCRRSIFNLKLPMKKRYDEMIRCRDAMDEICAAGGIRCALRFRPSIMIGRRSPDTPSGTRVRDDNRAAATADGRHASKESPRAQPSSCVDPIDDTRVVECLRRHRPCRNGVRAAGVGRSRCPGHRPSRIGIGIRIGWRVVHGNERRGRPGGHRAVHVGGL